MNGTSHGVHTASIAAGDIVTATYDGLNLGEISGVAPKAYVMSYRVFYASVTSIASFYTTEGHRRRGRYGERRRGCGQQFVGWRPRPAVAARLTRWMRR